MKLHRARALWNRYVFQWEHNVLATASEYARDKLAKDLRISNLKDENAVLRKDIADFYRPPQYSSGDSVGIRWKDSDYRFICCECSNVHILRLAVDKDNLVMQVFTESHIEAKEK